MQIKNKLLFLQETEEFMILLDIFDIKNMIGILLGWPNFYFSPMDTLLLNSLRTHRKHHVTNSIRSL